MKLIQTKEPALPEETEKALEAPADPGPAPSAPIESTRQVNFGRLRVSKNAVMAATIGLLPLLYFYPAVTGEISLVPGDGWTQNLGVRVLIGQMIAQGMVPLWDPYIFAGTPLLASIYPGGLYPPNWLFALFSPGVAMNLVVITTYHIALIGAYLYGRRIGMGRVGALVTGLGFAFGGFMVAHLGHTSRIAAAAWLPWVLLAMEHLYQRFSWRWVALGALFVALQLFAGEPQMDCYTVLVAGAYGIFSLTSRAERERRRRFVAGAAAMAVCGLLLSAIQLLPERELLRMGERAQISYEYFSGYALPPWQLPALIFPFFFGGAVRPPYQITSWGLAGIETFGYVGLLALLLGLTAVLGPRRRPLARFWAGTAVASVVLAFGSYLPFKLNRLLYQIPVYNLFRVSGRNMLEFTFAAAVLAGLGVSYLAERQRDEVRRALGRSTAVLTAVVLCTVMLYRFFEKYLENGILRPERAGSLTNLEVLVPLTLFILGLGAVWFYASRRTLLAGTLLVAVMAGELVSFGHFFEWRTTPYRIADYIGDAPSVKYIKAREPNRDEFRILSHAAWPYDYNYELLDHPNVSIARGLQSVNGYDALRLTRVADISGEMSIDGVVGDLGSFGALNQGFNLLNVKYLLRERRTEVEVTHEGLRFNDAPLNLTLGPGAHAEMMPGSVAATELALVTTMGRSTHLPQATPVVRIRLHAKDGRVIEREIQVGRDTAEWAYDRADVRSVIKHQRPRVVESWKEEGYEGHRYLARFPFERAEVERIEWDYLSPDAELQIVRASLYDATADASTPLDGLSLPPERWRKLESFGQVDLYENLKLMPRAWFVRRLAVAPRAGVLRAIKEGKLPDGMPFDPAEVALFEKEDFGRRVITLPPVGETAGAQVKVTRYEPHRIELQTHNPEPAFLVLSEIYYRGWEAWVDGQRTPVYRPDYTLRGIAVPPGDHRVEFAFRSPSFRNGAFYSGLGVMLLLIGAVVSRVRSKTLADADPKSNLRKLVERGASLFK